MNTEQQQQRIMGYFIEEAKDHLNTIEQGVLNLQDVLLDTEMRNEMFRAAHSIKGGAAMLGVVSVQHISHRLEDYFKILQEHSHIQVDEKLKSLFLAGFDRLQELIEQLEINYKISDELASSTLESVKPIFIELEAHLNKLVDGADDFGGDLVSTFQVEVASKIRDMLQLFKQQENSASRRELEGICSDLLVIGNNLSLVNWCELVTTAKAAIAFADNSYHTLAPVIIKDTKYAQGLVIAGRDRDISISPELLGLIPTSAPIASFDDDDMTVFMDNLSLDTDISMTEISMDELFSDSGLEYVGDSSDFDDLSDLFDEAKDPIFDDLNANASLDSEVSSDYTFEFDNLLESGFESSFDDAIAEDLGFADLGLEDLLQDSIVDQAESLQNNSDNISDAFQDDDLGLDEFFSATEEESLEAIDAGTWSGDSDTSNEFFDEFANEFSMVTEITDDQGEIENIVSASVVSTDVAAEIEDEISFEDMLVSPGDRNSESNDDFMDFADFSSNEPLVITDEFADFNLDSNLDEPDSESGLDEAIADFADFSSASDLSEPLVITDEFSDFELDDNLDGNLDESTSESGLDEAIADFADFSSASDLSEPLVITDEFSDFNLDSNLDEPDSESGLDEAIADFSSASDLSEPLVITDEFADLNESNIEQELNNNITDSAEFNDLDTFLDETDDNLTESVSSLPSFDDLETLIELPIPVATRNEGTDDFDDLEELLRDSNELSGTTVKPTRRPTAVKRQTSKIISQTMKVEVKHLDSLNNLVGELVVNRNLLDQDQEKMQQFLDNLLNQVQLLSDVSQKMRDQYDRSLLESSLVATREQSKVSTALMVQRGDDERSRATSDFDSIELDRFSDFHSLSQEIIELIVRVRESASDIEFVVGETEQVTRQLGVITNQVQDDLKQSRMVPFAQIADRLPRAVRDLAIKTGKEAEIDIRGRETLIDKAILEQLYDPMTHLVTNAIVHGLEDPNTRLNSGKQAKGIITVRAYHQGNQTIISVSDDGAGIDPNKVKSSALAKGVRTQEEVDQLSDDEVFELLFEAGFSTKNQADEFAGRGVGLDVVSTALTDIRGTVFTESNLGKGTSFTIRLPLTLSISKAMVCVSNRTRIAFPVDGFEDTVEAPQNQVFVNDQGQSWLTWRNTTLPFQPLSNLLGFTRHVNRSSVYNKQEDDVLSIIVLRNDTGYLALQVDQFLGEFEIVIKQLEGPIPKPVGIAGATILGDGRVMAIANVLELFDIASGRLKPTHSSANMIPVSKADEVSDPTVLIVDDSITVRELLSLTFSKVGYRVEQAKDGKDAWEKLRAGMLCNLIFCDIEMPRMNGLELLARIQKDEVLSKIPIAMLTSRGSDTHRNEAKELGAKGYFTKPYLEEEVITGSKRLLAGELLSF